MDIEVLRYDIRNMKPRSKLYKALRQELGTLGYWKCKARGNPSKAGQISYAKKCEDGSV